jgi:hypothetical protein
MIYKMEISKLGNNKDKILIKVWLNQNLTKHIVQQCHNQNRKNGDGHKWKNMIQIDHSSNILKVGVLINKVK